ncbi:MAG TPA: DoxX family protein [Ignavibacteria bacterium]|nr:DoxX family protein [Ignavibacteria bacterium]HMQ98656.1 DoxX family protein [Ignavibacteria bacterium]
MIKNFFQKYSDAGILFIRIGIGIPFVFVYGIMKIEGGPEMWQMVGSAMSNIKINFGYVFWGFLASASEFFGGIFLLLGLFTRMAAALMAFTMLMAFVTHLSMMDPWHVAVHPMELFGVFMGLVFIGAGRYSLDNILFRKNKQITSSIN